MNNRIGKPISFDKMLRIYYTKATEDGYCYCERNLDGIVMISNDLFIKIMQIPEVKEIIDNC